MNRQLNADQGHRWTASLLLFALLFPPTPSAAETPSNTLAGTARLEMNGEIDRQLIAGVSKFLDGQLAESPSRRAEGLLRVDSKRWPAELESRRKRLRHILGMHDSRPEQPELELIATPERSAVIASHEHFEILAVRWNAFGDVQAEGMLVRPRQPVVAQVVAIPDADQTPEQLVGLAAGGGEDSRYPILLASHGVQVLIPTLVSRQRDQFAWHGRRADISNRELLYRSAFVLGRHLVGYETQKVLAGLDCLHAQYPKLPMGVVGWGEGGSIALYASALDERIETVCVSGHFEPRERIWQQPIDRNVFGLLNEFGDAELAVMIGNRRLIVEANTGPQFEQSGGGGAPARLVTPLPNHARQEYDRAKQFAKRLDIATDRWSFASDATATATIASAFNSETLNRIIKGLSGRTLDAAIKETCESVVLKDSRSPFDPHRRLHRQMRQLDSHTQRALRESRFVRQAYLHGLNKKTLDEFEASQPTYREQFAKDVIGRFDIPLLPPHARTRLAYEKEKWLGYEVVLDVYPEVIAYGLLLLPRDLKPDEKRPVVVCQHGLEGRPQDVIGEESYHYYKAFAARLAERGFITFAPQNLYRHRDDFRVLQRKANPLGKTLFSIITPQHQQIINWLKAQPNVDPDRIAFYGLSYGGKTAMRVPALLTDYCLSICSADFNEWVDKNASTRNPRSYVWTGEYEIFEWDLGSTFNYAEMAALIAPRPFMVERGHDDGVADDETVAYEFAKVRRRYVKLGIGDRCEIEWFNGPHTINGQGTFEFLHRHLKWPQAEEQGK